MKQPNFTKKFRHQDMHLYGSFLGFLGEKTTHG